MASKPTVVFDTQIILRALINPRSVCGRLLYEHAPHYRLAISASILAEIVDVLNRPAIREKFPQITNERMAAVLSALTETELEEPEEIEPVSRDPKDDKFLACAKAAGATFLVSEDKDLLVLERFGQCQVVDAQTFLRVLETPKSE